MRAFVNARSAYCVLPSAVYTSLLLGVQYFTVVPDTGSGDLWVPLEGATDGNHNEYVQPREFCVATNFPCLLSPLGKFPILSKVKPTSPSGLPNQTECLIVALSES